ncbi:hypothetical protein D3C87_1866800 [compost metagenome]
MHFPAVVPEEVAHAGMVDAACGSAQHDHAAGRQAGRSEAFRGCQQHRLDGVARGGRGQQRASCGAAFGLAIELDGFTKQIFF